MNSYKLTANDYTYALRVAGNVLAEHIPRAKEREGITLEIIYAAARQALSEAVRGYQLNSETVFTIHARPIIERGCERALQRLQRSITELDRLLQRILTE